MNALPVAVIVAATLTLSACGKGSELKGPPQGKIVDVEIVVGSKADLDKQCVTNAHPTTVFVVSQKEVYHCIGKKLVHHDEHGKTAGMDEALVRVSSYDRIRWFSKTNLFTVVSVTKQNAALGPQNKAAPDLPFGKAFALAPAAEVLSEPVPDLEGVVVQRYKVTFNIAPIGEVDPDVVCSF
jgi:hypothetical protein